MRVVEPIVIAVDGFSSCGKSTFAKEIAKMLGFIYIDSGAMYRAFALYCLNNGLINDGKVNEAALNKALEEVSISFKISDTTHKQEVFLNESSVEEEIRTQRISEVVSIVASIPIVRKYLVDWQQAMGHNKGIVMDGRDIGTVVFPAAELKIYMNASSEIRAQRRYKELIEKGQQVNFDAIKANIEERDRLDLTRKASPLVKAHDAIELDNSDLTPDEQMVWIKRILQENNFIKL